MMICTLSLKIFSFCYICSYFSYKHKQSLVRKSKSSKGHIVFPDKCCTFGGFKFNRHDYTFKNFRLMCLTLTLMQTIFDACAAEDLKTWQEEKQFQLQTTLKTFGQK